jgi:hypothetical protein
MRVKKRLVIGATVILVVAGAYLASPLVAVRSFVSAARSGDSAKLDAAVDFSAVRESLKPQVSAAVTSRSRDLPRIGGVRLAGLGTLLAPAIADRAVDGIVTPRGIAALVTMRGTGHDEAAGPPARERTAYHYRYVGLDRFLVQLNRTERPDEVTGFTFERRNLFWWKLVRIDLPDGIVAP